jgi:formiminoglutamase
MFVGFGIFIFNYLIIVAMSINTIIDFLDPINIAYISNDEGYKDTQIGKNILINDEEFPNLNNVDAIIVGCCETRGMNLAIDSSQAANEIRKEFYSLFHWHNTVKIADIGNVKQGATLQDSYAALQTVLQELIPLNKKIIIIGGSHDNTLAQYAAYASLEKLVEIVCIDAAIDLNMDSVMPCDNFLMEVLTGEPNFTKHYTHIGFQSFLVHPHMLETIDKLRFDCYRVGKVKENIEEIEPAIRGCNFVSFDISAIQHAHAPANLLTPNGFSGEDACSIMQYAGMSQSLTSIGLFGFDATKDAHNLTAKQLSHMMWYILDGIYKAQQEAPLSDSNNFNTINISGGDFETIFMQSKKTGRWWMQQQDGNFMACSVKDYITTRENEIPERWLRQAERG